MKLSNFYKGLIIIITICMIVLVIGFISLKVNISPNDEFIIILRDIFVPIGTLLTLFLLYGTLREYQKTNKINVGKDIFDKHLKIIDNIKFHISMDKKFKEITSSIPFKSVYSNHFEGMNFTFWSLITFINSDNRYQDYITRLNKKDDTLISCKDEVFQSLNDSYKVIFDYLNYVSSQCKYFVNVLENIINDKNFMSDEQYNFIIKYVNDFLSGYYTLCEEKNEFKDVYFVGQKLGEDKETNLKFIYHKEFSNLFQSDFDSHYKLIKEMLKKIPIQRTFITEHK